MAAIPIDSAQLAGSIDYSQPIDGIRRQVQNAIEDAIAASKGTVIQWRSCQACGGLFRVGPAMAHGCHGMKRVYCSEACRQRQFRKLANQKNAISA